MPTRKVESTEADPRPLRKGDIMESLPNVLILVLMFALRLGVPLLITIAIALGLKQLDAKWQAEAENNALAEPAPGLSTQSDAVVAEGRS